MVTPRNRKGLPKVRLTQATYEAWIGEDPKVIDGPITLDYDVNGNPFFQRVPFSSELLPEQYADLIVYGTSDRFSGFKVYATPARYEMLLRADQRHGDEEWEVEGKRYGPDQPHFHELDFSNGRKKPGGRVRVPPMLVAGVDAQGLSEAFFEHYTFEPEGYQLSPPPEKKPGQRQASLFELAGEDE